MQTARSKDIIKEAKRPYNVMAMAITVWSFLFKKICILITRAIKSGTILSGRNVVFGLSPGFYFRKGGYRLWFKTIALVLTGLFLINNLSWAYDGGLAIHPKDTSSFSDTAHVKQVDIDRFEIPLNFGNVKNKYIGTSGKTIIHIQDAHCNYSCQQSIKGILNYLTSEYGIDLALLEGGAGDYDLSIFTDIEGKSLREKVADYFVKEGRVNGAEFFAITNPTQITLKGLENPNLYIKNLRVYRESLAYKDEIDKILNLLGHYLTNLKRHIYSRELKELDLKRADYNDKKIELNDYLGYLSDLSKKLNIDISTRKNLYRLIEVIEKEKNIDFKEANFERKRLIDELTKRLSSLELEALVKKSIHFKEGSIREIQFYSYLFKKAETVDFNVDTNYPNLSRYKKYIDIYESIDNWTLFNEIEKFEDDIVDRLCKNDAQKELYILSKNLLLLKDLFNISLTIDRYKYYRENSHSLNIAHFLSFINTEAPKYKIKTNISEDIKALDIYREKIENFYKLAFKRDNVFIKNITSYMKKRDNLTVVTGGFHTENLEKLFKEKGYSYLTIMPNFENDNGYENPYFTLLAGHKNPIESKLNSVLNYSLALASALNSIDALAYGEKQHILFNLHVRWMIAVASGRDGLLLKHGDKTLLALDSEGNISLPEDKKNYDITYVTEYTPSLQLPTPEKDAALLPIEKFAITDSYGNRSDFSIDKKDIYKSPTKLLQWFKANRQDLIVIVLSILGICYLFPRLITRIRQGPKYQYSRSALQKAHKRGISQKVGPSLAPRPRHEKTVIKKFPKNWNSNIDLSVAKTAGIGGTVPWEAPLANETIAAGIEGKIYGPLFKAVSFNFKSNGELIPPADLTFIPQGSPDGTTGKFEYRAHSRGRNAIEPLTHLRGIIDPSSIKICPLDENGISLPDREIPFNLKNGRIIEFSYNGRIRLELEIVNYYENIMLDYTQEPLPENELRDFPDAFAMDIIKYIRQDLARYEDLSKKLVELVDVDGMTLREKLDAIAEQNKSSFIPETTKLQAVVNVMNKYGLVNPRNAKMEHNGISWGSTWDEIIAGGQKIRFICNTSARKLVLLCQRVGLKAGYVPDSEGLARKGNFIIKGNIPHAMAVVQINGKWMLIETTKLMPQEADIITSSGGSVFEGEAGHIPSGYVFRIGPDNHEEEQEMRRKDEIMQKIEELKHKKDKGSAGWWLNLGKNYYRAGYWDEAMNCFTKGFQLKPDMIRDAYYRHEFIEACREQGKHMTAIEYIEDYLPEAQDIEAHVLWSIWDDLEGLYRDIEDKERAIEFLEDFIEERPEDKYAWEVLGQIYPMRTGDKGIEKTIRFLNKFLQKYPDNSRARYALRDICIRENNIDASMQEIKKLLKPRLSNKYRPFWLYEVLGELYVEKDMPDKALEAYKHVAEIHPVDTESWKRAGFKLYHKGHFKHSIKAFEKALEFEANQNDADLWKRLGFAYKKTKNYNQTIEAYRKALDISVSIEIGEYPRTYVIYDLVDMYKDHATDRMDEAISYFTAVSKNNPEKFQATMALAKLYKSNKRYGEAINAYKKGMKAMLDESHYRNDELEELAQIYSRHVPEKIDEGIGYFETLFIEYPKHSTINNTLAQMYVEKKLFDKAITLHKDWITRVLNEENRYAEYNVYLLTDLYVTHRKNMINEGIAYFERLLKRVSDGHKNDIIVSIARLHMGKQDFSNALIWYRKIMESWKPEKEQDIEKFFERGHLIRSDVQFSLPDSEKKPSKNYDNNDFLGFIDCLIGAKEYQEAKGRCITYLRRTRGGYYFDFAEGWKRLSDICKGLGEDKNAELAEKYYREYVTRNTPIPNKKELEEILKKFDDPDGSETIKKREDTANLKTNPLLDKPAIDAIPQKVNETIIIGGLWSIAFMWLASLCGPLAFRYVSIAAGILFIIVIHGWKAKGFKGIIATTTEQFGIVKWRIDNLLFFEKAVVYFHEFLHYLPFLNSKNKFPRFISHLIVIYPLQLLMSPLLCAIGLFAELLLDLLEIDGHRSVSEESYIEMISDNIKVDRYLKRISFAQNKLNMNKLKSIDIGSEAEIFKDDSDPMITYKIYHSDLKRVFRNNVGLTEAKNLVLSKNLGLSDENIWIPELLEIGFTIDNNFYIKTKGIINAKAISKSDYFKRLSMREKIVKLIHIAAFLERCHKAGYIFGDCYPSNILINEEDHLMIIDFSGFAKSGTNRRIINMEFSPPEYLNNGKIKIYPSFDIYSFGMSLKRLFGDLIYEEGIIARKLYELFHWTTEPYHRRRPSHKRWYQQTTMYDVVESLTEIESTLESEELDRGRIKVYPPFDIYSFGMSLKELLGDLLFGDIILRKLYDSYFGLIIRVSQKMKEFSRKRRYQQPVMHNGQKFVADKKELEEILKKFDDPDDSETIKKREDNDNVTCGTICQAGHQELLDPQFERYYRGLRRDANIKKKILDSNDVISALEKTGKLKELGTTKEQLREIIEYIHQEAAIPDNIQILFAIPENNSKLWWIEDPETGKPLYAGGHFNGEGTRIHISLPLILSQANPKQAALAIARHDYNHIREKRHHEDEGMRIVRKAAESGRPRDFAKAEDMAARIEKGENRDFATYKKRDSTDPGKLIYINPKSAVFVEVHNIPPVKYLKSMLRQECEFDRKVILTCGAQYTIAAKGDQAVVEQKAIVIPSVMGEIPEKEFSNWPIDKDKNHIDIVFASGEDYRVCFIENIIGIARELQRKRGNSVSYHLIGDMTEPIQESNFAGFSPETVVDRSQEYRELINLKILQINIYLNGDLLLKSPSKDKTPIANLYYWTNLEKFKQGIMWKPLHEEDASERKTSPTETGELSKDENFKFVVQRVLKYYDLGEYVDYKKAMGGYKNKGYWVKTTKGEYFLKDNRAYADQIAEMSAFEININHFVNTKVKEKGYKWRVPYLYATKDGKGFSRISGKAFMIYEFVHGDFAGWGEQGGKRLAPTMKMMTELHNVLSEYSEEIPDYRRTTTDAYHDLPQKVKVFKRLRASLSAVAINKRSKVAQEFLKDADVFINAMEHIKTKFPPRAYNKLPKQLVHLDAAPIHIMYRGIEPIMIIDWENVNVDTRAIDFVKGIAPFHDFGGYDEFINSVAYYQMAADEIGNPLDRLTLKALPYIHTLHRLKLATSILHHNLRDEINLDWPLSQMRIFANLASINFDNFPTVVKERIKHLKSAPQREVRRKTVSSGNILNRMMKGKTGGSDSSASPIQYTKYRTCEIRSTVDTGNYNFAKLKVKRDQAIDIDGYSEFRIKLKLNNLIEEEDIVNQRASFKLEFKYRGQSVYITRTPDIKEKDLFIDIPEDLDRIDEIVLVFENTQSTIRHIDFEIEEMEFVAPLKETDLAADRKTIMEPSYIKETGEKILDTLTGENGAERAPLMTQPCTIGLVLKADSEKKIEDVLKEQLAKEWDVITRKVEPKVLKERGILEYKPLGNIKYVIYIDDGTNSAKNLARLREFRGILEQRKQANPKGIIFAWVFSDEARSEIGDIAYMVGLEGEFLSVSWQMLTGQHFANFIHSKLNKPNAEERITDLIDKIAKCADWMTRGAIDLKTLRRNLENVTAEGLIDLFNGIKLILPIPRPLTPDLAEYQKADKAVQLSL